MCWRVRSHSLDKQEFRRLIEGFNIALTDATFAGLMAQIDPDNSGEISYQVPKAPASPHTA